MVGLSKDGYTKHFRLNRLVLLTFVGEPPSGMQACHNNGDRVDNRLVNLRWDTPLSNTRDKMTHGTQAYGPDISSSKLTAETVREARRLYIPKHLKYGNNALAKRYGVSNPTMHKAIQGKTWKTIKDND
ncbi:HNH endonuclease [Streptomyces sp. NPDC048212]|uniref:HNH endonuclease n=1 Tax=Streptomyces sp. NPDC048212 TaxID=3156658 RepID=UPI0033D68529